MKNETITNMTFEDIEKLTSNQKEQFENFKRYIESYNQSFMNLQRAKENLRYKINEKNSYCKTSKKYIPLKVYISLSSIILIGVLFSFTIYKYDALNANQVYIKILILILNFIIIFFVSFVSLIILLKKY
jgi:hypothetical protein